MKSTTILYDLPDSDVDRCDGPIYEAMKKAGHDVKPRTLINNWSAWGWTVQRLMLELGSRRRK